jgi:predicted nucleotidyltransferase
MASAALPDLPDAIHEMTRRLVREFSPEKIILFGSYARGTAGPDSDADLLVVIRQEGSQRRKAVEMERALAGVGLPKDLVLATPEDLERCQGLPGTLIRAALQEGIVLHES